ncbi:MAG: hypothetical protein NTW98_01770 [Candidatus Nomurabacteria bacterium]|nr:hypothetical protein [Candidatus Nomurabacteria bacterium]
MTWAFRRQITYVVILFVFFLGFGAMVSYPYLTKDPTCNDGKQNGTEVGVDCGGSCQLVCASQVDKISVVWSRIFQVVPGRYNAVAYLENQNPNTAVYKIKYKFRFADKDNIYLGQREGETYIPPAGNFAIFEPAIDMGNSVPVYTTFEFLEAPVWVKVAKEKTDLLELFVSDIVLEDPTTAPHLSAKLSNDSLYTIPDVNIIAILYDELGNAYLNSLNGETEAAINFTWPEPFLSTVVTKEIIPMYNIFNVKLR